MTSILDRLRPGERLLEPVVRPLLRSLVAEAAGSEADLDEAALARAAQAMRLRVGLMPRFLGMPMAGATLFFDAGGVLVGGRPFRWLDDAQRRRFLALWRRAPISFFQDFLDFYGKMGTFVYYSELEGE